MNPTTETAPATGADTSGARKGGLNAMLLPELKQLAGGLGIKATGMRKGALIEAIKTAQGGGQSSKRDNDSSNAKQAANETITSTHPGAANVMIDMVEDNPYVVMRNQMSWADLLVLGTHSKGSLATSVTIGSLARHLLAETACDVLVSRP